jgi:hypothetical protein
VLPGVLPNLLVNGCSGIAVGMATEVPPHNLREVCDAIVHVIEHPDATPEALAQIVKGPDFPTGGIIYGTQGIRDCYTTGRGLIKVRARVQVEEGRAGRMSLVATEIPFQVSKASLLEKIAGLVRQGRITGISDLRDESDRDGMRVVIELKKDTNPKVVLNQLFVHTPLQVTFGASPSARCPAHRAGLRSMFARAALERRRRPGLWTAVQGSKSQKVSCSRSARSSLHALAERRTSERLSGALWMAESVVRRPRTIARCFTSTWLCTSGKADMTATLNCSRPRVPRS